ncbi:MAG: sugar ABC transporter permease [Chloroflexia bacterium]|nr:sugar ABC transporter permease [Chloroflexia bacterium]
MMIRWRFVWRLLAILFVVALALLLRARAVRLLPVDYDEDDYLRAAQQQAAAMRAGDWGALSELNYRPEHPPLAKLAYAAALSFLPPAGEIPDRPTSAPPAGDLPQPHLDAARWVAAGLGTLEVLLVALASPLGGLFLAVHTFSIKYTSQVMLEALPALTSLAAVLAYERSRGRWNAWLALSALALGLTAASKYVYCMVALVILGHWLWTTYAHGDEDGRSWPQRLAPLLAWGALALAVFLAADPYLWPDPLGRLRDSLLYHAGYAQSAEVRRLQYPFWQPLVTLMHSVPWHPGVFVVSLDLVITALAALGLGRLRQKRPLLLAWLVVALGFLLAWPTKWPQYILMLTAPLSVAAAEGFMARVWEPLRERLRRLRAEGLRRPARSRSPAARRETRRAIPWLLPGVVVLLLLALFPLVYQGLMALTDFNATSIRDGLQGGLWRETWLGLTGQVEPADVALSLQPGRRSNEVRYVGLGWFAQLFSADLSNLIVFELLWTVLSVGLQAALGVGVALILHRKGLRFKGWWRTLFILPWAIPEFVGALVWMRLIHPTFGWYTLAVESHTVVLPQIAWFENPQYALLGLLLAGTWYGWPVMLLASAAGLNMVPADVYEAAAIDGASGWQLFRQVTWPLLLPLLLPLLIVRGIFAFNQFYLFFVLQTPFPLSTFSTVSFSLFNPMGYAGGQFALSAALNLFTVAILILLLLWFNRWSRAAEGVRYA